MRSLYETVAHEDWTAAFDRLSGRALRAAKDGIAACDATGRIVLWNPAMERITGRDARDAVGRSAFDTLPGMADPGEQQRLRHALSGLPPERGCRIPSGTGTGQRLLEVDYAPLPEDGHEAGGALATVHDVTEARRAEERIEESERRFRIMADSAPVLLWMSGTDALCDFFNQVWLAFTGRPLEAELGNGWASGVHPEDFQHCMAVYMTAFVAREPFRMEYRLRRADGQYRWILDQGVPRYAPGGAFAGFIGSCIDITELKEAHEALQRVNEQLELRVRERTAELVRSNAELEQFAYVASHDLQEPLRTIASYLQLLAMRSADRLDGDAREFIQHAVSGAQRLQGLIQDLLAYARVGQAADLPSEPFPCDDALDLALGNLAHVIEETGARIERGPLPVVVGDRTQVAQLFQNLLDNALKFRRGTPEIRVGAERRGGECVLSVRDNGIGIETEYLDRIFRVFQRLHARSQYPGTGIGLAICKRVVERHGGRLWVESTPGQGTTFSFTLPVG